jgi:hypothetical protein
MPILAVPVSSSRCRVGVDRQRAVFRDWPTMLVKVVLMMDILTGDSRGRSLVLLGFKRGGDERIVTYLWASCFHS